jgi:hypothetical protein
VSRVHHVAEFELMYRVEDEDNISPLDASPALACLLAQIDKEYLREILAIKPDHWCRKISESIELKIGDAHCEECGS